MFVTPHTPVSGPSAIQTETRASMLAGQVRNNHTSRVESVKNTAESRFTPQ